MWHGVSFDVACARHPPKKQGTPHRFAISSFVLAEGAKIPSVTVPDDAGTSVDTGKLTGKTLVLWFYPKDDTPG